jgi:predicted phage tail protein
MTYTYTPPKKRDPALKKIQLYGDMGRRFGRVHWLAVNSPAEAIRALRTIKPGFDGYLRERYDAPFRVLRGDEALDEEGLQAPVSRAEVIKIVPVVAGSGGKGWGQIFLGAALIVASTFIPGAWMIGTTGVAGMVSSLGIAMALGGVASLLAGTPNVNNAGLEGSNDIDTFSFSNPTLTTGQGGVVPVLIGEMMIGGHIISAGIDAHTWIPGGFDETVCLTDDGTRYGNGDSIPWMWAKGEA